jgi:acetylornithine/N-succinyldiaminopimelate aminotransferase
MTLAKGMANGLPIGAVLATPEIADAFQPGDHGSTFAGGPVVCAAARATIDALEAGGLGENAQHVGAYLRARLSDIGSVTGEIVDVRGRGLMVGVTLARPIAAEVAAKSLELGVVVLSVGDSVLRFLPPLVCNTAEVDTLLGVLSLAIGDS